MAMATQATYGAPATKKMKLEHDGSQPGTPQPLTSTPAPTYTTTAHWSTPIPIDPALQQQPSTTTTTTTTTTAQTQAPTQATVQQFQRQAPVMNYQHYQAYGSTHYPQYTAQHYAQYQPAQTTTVSTVPAAPASTTTATASLPRQATQTAQDTDQNADISTLNDAVGSAGLDLRAEEETLQRSQDYYSTYRSYEDRSRRQPNSPAFDSRLLGATMRAIGTRHKVSRIPEDAVNYLALALRTRLQTLIEGMAGAARHRSTAQFDHDPSLYEGGTPMWSAVVRQDLKKQLEVLERVEREEEMRLRRERRERADAAAAAASAQALGSPQPDGADTKNGDDAAMDGTAPAGKKLKKKKDGPGVTAKNLSEDVQKRLSNATAAQAAGLGRGKYAWMNAGAVSTSASPAATKPKPLASAPATQPTPTVTQPATSGQTTGTSSSWSKPYVPASTKASQSPAPGDEDKTVVTMRDAMFIIERERGHGGGRGAARGWV